MQQIQGGAGVASAAENRHLGQGDLVVGVFRQEGGGGGSCGLGLVGDPQQHALGGQQTGSIAARLLRQKMIDVLQASQELLAVDHAVDFLQFRQEIAAAELDFLARAAGTKRICVERHEGVVSG